MTWKELKDKISLMTEEEQQQEVAVWGEYLNLMKDCSLEKTNENMYYNSEWDYTLLLSLTVIGLVISVSDEWQEMGDKIIDKL